MAHSPNHLTTRLPHHLTTPAPSTTPTTQHHPHLVDCLLPLWPGLGRQEWRRPPSRETGGAADTRRSSGSHPQALKLLLFIVFFLSRLFLQFLLKYLPP